MVRVTVFLSLAALVLAGCDSDTGGDAQGSAERAGAEGPDQQQLSGEVVRDFAGTPLPALDFADPQGNILDTGALGKPVLVNLWATWCGPCVVEMPALDALAGALQGEVKVLTISQDIRGADVVVPFFATRDFEYLEQWLDPENELALAFSDAGVLPVTILFDAEGKEILRVTGGYEWDSEEAIALVREAAIAPLPGDEIQE